MHIRSQWSLSHVWRNSSYISVAPLLYQKNFFDLFEVMYSSKVRDRSLRLFESKHDSNSQAFEFLNFDAEYPMYLICIGQVRCPNFEVSMLHRLEVQYTRCPCKVIFHRRYYLSRSAFKQFEVYTELERTCWYLWVYYNSS